MCKASVPQPSPTNEVAEQIKNTTSVDNSWSFINLHLPSTITTAVIIFIIIISAWILLRVYTRFTNHLHHHQSSLSSAPPLSSVSLSTVILSLINHQNPKTDDLNILTFTDILTRPIYHLVTSTHSLHQI